MHKRARRAILVNARSERHFKMQGGYFGYCQIYFNAEKIIILPILFHKTGGLTQLCCNLVICVKIVQFIPSFLVVIFRRLTFQRLKRNQNNCSLSQHVLQKRAIGFAKTLLRITLQNMAHFGFSMQNCIHYLGRQQY